jgi:hypothetical protein
MILSGSYFLGRSGSYPLNQAIYIIGKFINGLQKGSIVEQYHFLRFQFILLKSYSSGSDFWQVPVPIPVPYLDNEKQFSKILLEKILLFLHSKLFYKETIEKFHQIFCKMWMKKMLNEGIKYTILYCVFVGPFVIPYITVPEP